MMEIKPVKNLDQDFKQQVYELNALMAEVDPEV
jgi:hypothetical protein